MRWTSGMPNRLPKRLLGGVAALIGASAGIAQDPVVPVPTVSFSQTTSAMIRPVPQWTLATARQLDAAIEASAAEGLRPRDYRLDMLRRVMAQGEGPTLDAAARLAALALAHDYLMGRVADREAMDWYIRPTVDMADLSNQLDAAVGNGTVAAFLASLLPTDPRYVALRDALANTTDFASRDTIRANMERWRWMPRTLGASYIYVNVPSYRLQVVDNGMVASSYTVVVGAPDTPTPQMATDTGSLVVNPWWNVPQSIVKKSALRPGRAGFVFKASGNGSWAVRQPPGPRNSLGRIKFNLVNDQAIYLHDTPAKALFGRDQRALSHGCIRVQNIDRLASELMEGGDRTAQLDDALASDKTATLRLPRTWTVYLVYFTMDQSENGRLVRLPDPYARDAALLARLDGGAMEVASN